MQKAVHMSIIKGDIIFSRGGKPVQVTSKDPRSGNVTLDSDFDKVRAEARMGIKNGLEPDLKDAYRTTLSETGDDDARARIDKLHARIQDMKKENANPRLVRYLEGELHYLMTRERHTPSRFEFDAITATSY